jgi:hypothetical protein
VKDSAEITNAAEVFGSQHLYQQAQPQAHILYPDVAPDTASPLAIQPCAGPMFVPVGFATTPVPAQPMRVKRKGLLERSVASLPYFVVVCLQTCAFVGENQKMYDLRGFL